VTLPDPVGWPLTVATVTDVTPRMRRIELSSPALAAFDYLPGQDMALAFSKDDGTSVRRRYTIRRFDRNRASLAIDVLMHGNGPGMRWAQAARPGVSIDAIGPRGKITLADDADWHLFAGDATAVPGAFAMMETLADHVPAHAFLLVDGPEERQPFSADGPLRTIAWRYERSQPAESSGLVSAVAAADLPGGHGHAYLAGEVALVSALKAALLNRGWEAEQISAKAYWNRGRANAGHGEPELRAS
jgi:NADPH-dependent ferric siderophore reductase